MNDVVLKARIEAEVAAARAGIQAVQGDLVKLAKGAVEASTAGKTLGASLMVPQPLAISAMVPTLAEISAGLREASQTSTALASAQAILSRSSQGVAVDMAKLAGVSASVTPVVQEEIDALIRLDQEIDQLRRSVAPAITAEEMLAAAQAKVTAAIKAGLITQAEANALADQARVKFAAVEKGAFAAAGGARMFGQQLSQVFQQGAVTGNYLAAFATQLPDMALGFGNVAIAASIVATVALPVLINAFGGGKTAAEKATEANEDYAKSFDTIAADLTAASDLHDRYAAAVKSGSAVTIAALQSEASIRKALLELDQNDLEKAQRDAEVKVHDALQAQADLQSRQTEILNRMAEARAKAADDPSGTQTFLEEQQLALDAVTKKLDEQRDATKRIGLEFDLNKAKIEGNKTAIEAAKQALAEMASGTAPLISGLDGAAAAASGIGGALETALGIAQSLEATINGMALGNIGKTAELAALKAGQSPQDAKAAGSIAEKRASLAPALSSREWDPLESTCRHASLSIL